MADKKPTGLDLLREPFAPHQISKLPKETRAQIDERKSNRNAMVFNCPICGGHHHKNAVHLDYVGHAALTDRLLDCDPSWNWEPMAFDESGAPKRDQSGGMWIKLTVCGVTRLGYGHADGKSGGDAIKEVIGDALRNAAMRFGAALDLWHKGDLHAEPEEPANKPQTKAPSVHPDNPLDWDDMLADPGNIKTLNGAQSREPYKLLSQTMKMANTPAELAHWARENALAIWELSSTARHHLREEFDKLNESLMEAA